MTVRLNTKPAWQNIAPKPTPEPTKEPPSPPRRQDVLNIILALHKRSLASTELVVRRARTGAEWEEVVRIAKDLHQIEEPEVEECIDHLLKESIITEPYLGRLVPT